MELETAYVKPLCASLGFRRFAERWNSLHVLWQFDWSTSGGQVTVM